MLREMDGWDRDAIELHAQFQAGVVSPAEMAARLPEIWRFRNRCDPLDSPAAWRAMVDHAGYFTWTSGDAGRHGRRPWRSKRLYRGAIAERRFGMSWTTNLAIARDFAQHRQPFGDDDGQVWVGRFEPWRLLGHIGWEQEYLVDAAGADIQTWTPPP